MATKKEIEKYLNLPWSYMIEPEDDYFVISVNELPGVCTDAHSVEEGMKEIKDAIYAALELYLDQGREIPVPINKKKYKGNIAYRTSPEKHYQLAKLAQKEHKSLSKIIDVLIDEGISEHGAERRIG